MTALIASLGYLQRSFAMIGSQKKKTKYSFSHCSLRFDHTTLYVTVNKNFKESLRKKFYVFRFVEIRNMFLQDDERSKCANVRLMNT